MSPGEHGRPLPGASVPRISPPKAESPADYRSTSERLAWDNLLCVTVFGYTEMTALVQAFAARLGAAWSGGSLMTLMTEGVSVFFSSLVALMMGVPLVLGLVALFCLTYAQVIWAQVALAIVILLGPVFIPWLLFEPLAFLFWGWFRTLMVYTLYGVVAGAILRVFMGVGMGYVTTYTGALMGTGSSDPAELGLWVVVLLPLVVSGLMAGMKVGELAAMLVSGSGSVGSGMTLDAVSV